MRLAEAHPARRGPPERAVGGARETRATRRKRGTPRGGSGRGAGVDVPRQPSPRTPRERAREPAEEEKWIKRQWAFEDVAGERHALRARADGRRGVSREARPAFRRAPRWNERCVATNAASPDVPPRSSPAMSPRAGSRRRREPASAMLASRETWRVRDVPSGDVPAGARARRSPDEPRGSPPTPYQRKQTPLCVWRVVEARPRVDEWRADVRVEVLGFVRGCFAIAISPI